ncbi:MAG: PAS domain S-box protein [Deltaproteobacteria bacterium]|nr:PAS domain S-box protein [Deltaproteobacteria bacterium]
MKDENKTKKQLIAELQDMPRDSEDLFRAIFDNVRDGIALLDMTGRVIKINKRIIEVGGHTEEELIGKRIKLLKMFTPSSIVKMLSAFAKTVSGQHVEPYEVEFHTKQGKKINAEIHGSPFRKRGKVVGAVAVMRDVSERKQAEETLKQSEERLRQIADNVPDLIWAKDMDDRFIFVNQAMCNKLIMCGTQDEAIGKIDMFFAEREKKAGYKHSFGEICVNSDAITKKRKAPGRFLEDGFVRDKYLVLDVHKAPFLNKDGEMIGTVGCGRDVTEQKKMEEELLKAKKLESIGVLAGGIAHDYNNLLTAIIGNISLAQSYLKPDGEAFKLLSEAQKASMGAKDLTQKLITFSKGGTPIKKAAPISPLLKNTTELALSGSNIKCEWSIADDLWPIEIDEAQIGQVIHSLIINAREAMSEGGSVYVSAENISIDEEKDLLLNKGKHVKISIKT